MQVLLCEVNVMPGNYYISKMGRSKTSLLIFSYLLVFFSKLRVNLGNAGQFQCRFFL